MKRKILYVITLTILTCINAHAITGEIGVSDIKLSLSSGKAFVDFSTPEILTNFLGSKITVCAKSAPTQCAEGFIKSAGTGETYTDLIGGTNPNYRNGDFESGAVTWVLGTGWSISGGKGVGTNVSTNNMSQDVLPSPRYFNLYKLTYTTELTLGKLRPTFGFLTHFDKSLSGTYSDYYTYPSSGGSSVVAFRSNINADSFTGTIDNVTCQVVLSPSTTGVTIVSTKDGSTQDWSVNTFTNKTYDTTGYTYEIETDNYLMLLLGSDNTISYGLIDCEDSSGMIGILVAGTGNTIRNYTVARCPGGAFRFNSDASLVNSIGVSSGPDITIASGVTVTGKNNLFGDAAKSGDGTYSDDYNTTQWSTNPEFVDPDNGNFRLQSTSPAIDAGTRD